MVKHRLCQTHPLSISAGFVSIVSFCKEHLSCFVFIIDISFLPEDNLVAKCGNKTYSFTVWQDSTFDPPDSKTVAWHFNIFPIWIINLSVLSHLFNILSGLQTSRSVFPHSRSQRWRPARARVAWTCVSRKRLSFVEPPFTKQDRDLAVSQGDFLWAREVPSLLGVFPQFFKSPSFP